MTFNINRGRIRFFAPWANFKSGGVSQSHELLGGAVAHKAEDGKEYSNHIEMAGFYASSIVSYGNTDKGELRIMRHVIFPMLRRYPNNTHSSQDCNFKGAQIVANGKVLSEKSVFYTFDGMIKILTESGDIKIERTLFTAPTSPCLVERLTVANCGSSDVAIKIVNNDKMRLTSKVYGHLNKQYAMFATISTEQFDLKANESKVVSVCYCGANKGESLKIDTQKEFEKRQQYLSEMSVKLQIVTPDTNINAMTEFAKIRAAESIFKTKNGYMHSPGGGGYYAAMWTNDQCEYANPLLGYLGYKVGEEQAINCYEMFSKYIYKDKPLISSIIAEGDGVWHGAGDRGDGAMFLSGAARFVLAKGDKEAAKKLLGSMRNAVEFILSKKNSNGVIESDSDELENRFESGKANLCTSCLAYDALTMYAAVEKEIGEKSLEGRALDEAEKLKVAINNYFGAVVEDFDSYMYCKEETRLRSWICMPLVVDIAGDRAEETTKALLSSKLRKGEGLLTRSGEKTYWDRSTLYALRGIFYSGNADKALPLLSQYSNERLLGAHVPYAVEACPEGNQAQLSAESALYLRIFTEGIAGYRPVGFEQFELRPNLPSDWKFIKINSITLCGKVVDIDIARENGGYVVKCQNVEYKLKTDEKTVIKVK